MVCTGTQNSLSITGSQEKHYNLFKDRYEGCRIIMGNLEITNLDMNRDYSFLKVVSFAYTFPPPSFSIQFQLNSNQLNVLNFIWIALITATVSKGLTGHISMTPP